MDAASAYIIKRVLRDKWGENPCTHTRLEQITKPFDTSPGSWFCIICGRDVAVLEVHQTPPKQQNQSASKQQNSRSQPQPQESTVEED